MSAISANRRYTHLGAGLVLITADATSMPPVANQYMQPDEGRPQT